MQERFVVRYAVEWGEDEPRERVFPGLPPARDYARRVVADGTTCFPHVATILRQTRDAQGGGWRPDPRFGHLEVRRGGARTASAPTTAAAPASGP